MSTSSNRVWLRTGFVGLLVVSMVLLAGCSKSKKGATVSGKVSYPTADKPVTGGTIKLHPVDGKGQPFMISINSDGGFSGTGVPVGEMKVTVETASIKSMGDGNPYPMMQGMKPPAGVEMKAPDVDTSKMPKYVQIPDFYAKPDSTPLRWNIQPGPNTKDLNLTQSGK